MTIFFWSIFDFKSVKKINYKTLADPVYISRTPNFFFHSHGSIAAGRRVVREVDKDLFRIL